MLQELLILSQIIFITIILTADNAIIIGVISANFIPKNKKQIIYWGVAGALIFKIIFALFATYLFKFYFIKILGGLLLIWIVNDLRKDLFEIKKIKPQIITICSNAIWDILCFFFFKRIEKIAQENIATVIDISPLLKLKFLINSKSILVIIEITPINERITPVSYTHLTLPTITEV